MSIFDVRIPGLKMTIVAADGQDVEPVTVDELRIATAETYDAIVEPTDDRAYTVFAQSIDRSGYARGTLAPRMGMSAEIPPLDPRPILSMQDMGMGHGESHAPEAAPQASHASPTDHGEHGASDGVQLHHAAAESGPTVDMIIQQASSGLDDPGVGLRNNGRRVLSYADLHTIGGPIDRRAPGREIELHLTGHMERFIWSFNGQKFSEAEPLRFRHGERLRITLVNDTMMTHPIHLHGMWSELETPSGEFQVRKHTVMVNPAQRLSYAVTADALGRWAYHCHLLYHMEAGMFREVEVAHGDAAGGHGS
jgi:CopA family copper-resistance protein